MKAISMDGLITQHTNFTYAANRLKGYTAHPLSTHYPAPIEHRTVIDIRPNKWDRRLIWRRLENGAFKLVGMVTSSSDPIMAVFP